MEEKRDCAFQYYDGRNVVIDETKLTLDEAKNLFNEYYDDMVENTEDGYEIEVAIWVEMQDPYDYYKTLIHLSNPLVEDGVFYEKRHIQPFILTEQTQPQK